MAAIRHSQRIAAMEAARKPVSSMIPRRVSDVAAVSPPCSPEPDPVRTVRISRVFFWTHHMRVKQRLVYKWSAELRVTGRCKIGRPGWLLAEADADVMEEFIRRVKQEHWRRILLKWQSTDTLHVEVHQSPSGVIDRARLFPHGMREVLSANAFCKDLQHVGLQEALKAGTGLEMDVKS